MEEWIYLVLGFAWIILSAVIGNKKKKAKEKMPTYQGEAMTPYNDRDINEWNDLQEFFNKTENIGEKNISVETPIEIKTTPKIEKITHQNVKKSSIDEKLTKKIHSELVDYDFENQETTNENLFNLRQAIIFSEILRTPYID